MDADLFDLLDLSATRTRVGRGEFGLRGLVAAIRRQILRNQNGAGDRDDQRLHEQPPLQRALAARLPVLDERGGGGHVLAREHDQRPDQRGRVLRGIEQVLHVERDAPNRTETRRDAGRAGVQVLGARRAARRLRSRRRLADRRVPNRVLLLLKQFKLTRHEKQVSLKLQLLLLLLPLLLLLLLLSLRIVWRRRVMHGKRNDVVVCVVMSWQRCGLMQCGRNRMRRQLGRGRCYWLHG